MTVTQRPLRADAERNRRRIMDAARELFADRGLDVTLNDIARHAGVGVGTVYRRFPDKELLIEALFEERLAELEAIALAGLAMADPWEGIVATLTGVLELQEADRGFKELILSVGRRRDGIAPIRARMAPVVAELMARAKAAGQLRGDIGPQDFPLLQILLGAVIDVSRDASPGLWRRYLEADPPGHARRAGPAAAAARRGARIRADGPGAAQLAPAAARLSASAGGDPLGLLEGLAERSPLPRVRADHGRARFVDEAQFQALVPGRIEPSDREHVRKRDLAVQHLRGALRREPRAKSRDDAALEEQQPSGRERNPEVGTPRGPRMPRWRAVAAALVVGSRATSPITRPPTPVRTTSAPAGPAGRGGCAASPARSSSPRLKERPCGLLNLGRRIGHAWLLMAVAARTMRL